MEQQQAQGTHAPGLLLHSYGGVYSLELDGETWPSLEAVHAANPGHDPNNDTIITWV
jgi:hypothetical protein